MDKCPNCGQELEKDISKCPNCGSEIKKENVIEEVQVDPNNIISLDEEPTVETTNDIVEPEQTKTEPIPVVEEKPKEEPQPVVTTQDSVPVVEESPQELSHSLDETNIVNDSLETVSIEATEIKLEEEKPQVVNIEVPEMPEPTIAEINPDLLGNTYDEAERINNEKIEAKRQAELAELERKRQEEEAKKQAQAQAGKPDLLAGRNNGEIPLDVAPKKKKKKGVIITIIIVLLVAALIAFGLYYFLVLGKN